MNLEKNESPSMESRVARWQRFYDRQNNHPLLGFFLGSEYPLRRYNAARNLPEDRPLRPEDFDVAAFLDDHDRLFEAHEACGGDFIWSADAFWGIQWMECLCGLEMFCNHKSGNLHFHRAAPFRGPGQIPAFDPQGPWERLAGEFLRRTAAHSAGRYPIGTTRMRGLSDMLSALYGPEEFVYAMIDDPEQVREVCRRLTSLYIDFARFQLDRIPDFHGGIGSFYYANWAPPRTVWHQEDAAVMLSPDLYREHIREWNQRIVDSLPSNILHTHSVGFIPLDDYLKMGFIAIEMHIDQAGPSAEELCETHGKILDRKPLLIWGDLSEADMDWVFTRLPPQGLAINKAVHSADEAKRIYERFSGAHT